MFYNFVTSADCIREMSKCNLSAQLIKLKGNVVVKYAVIKCLRFQKRCHYRKSTFLVQCSVEENNVSLRTFTKQKNNDELFEITLFGNEQQLNTLHDPKILIQSLVIVGS